MKKLIIILCITFITGTLYSEMPYAFLEYGIGNSDVNRTGIINAGSASASFYNSALLVDSGNQFLFGYSVPFSRNFFIKNGETGIDGIGVYSYGISYSKKNYGIGMSGLMMKNSDIPGYDENGNETGLFSTYEGAVSLGYGIKLNEKMNLGFNNKIIYQRLYEGYSRVVGTVGIGILRKINNKLNISAVVDNLVNYKMSSDNIGYEAPERNYSIGIGYNIGRLSLSGALWSDLEDIMVGTGVNVAVMKWLEISGGIKNGVGYNNNEINAFDNSSVINTGLKFNIDRWSSDYSIGFQGSLGIKHTICGSYRY